MILFSES